ncbi:MAG: ATP synthase F1 subunit epsilon [Lachnospiraceae bacterium]|nr:ATP synthase F1 subunit epsilon [Lachnospiraceae bacterium]MDO4509073.1 ATP synthase F1 subunit epsilon [Lachnospiraceae bacterium]MDY5216068.1 ATP synthase F1 subunit epsilon [Lachnospiraceae bacterium]
MASDNSFIVKITAPDRLFYSGNADMIELTTTEGQIGVYKGHIPLTAVIAPGTVRIYETEGQVKSAALISGFVEILQDKVEILAEDILWPDEIDVKRAEEARIRAERRIAEKATDTNLARAELALKKAVVRIETVKGE